MKLLVSICFLFIAIVSYGQTKMTLYLKDGNVKTGYGERKGQNIALSNTKKEEAVNYDLKIIDSIYEGHERKPTIYHIVEG